MMIRGAAKEAFSPGGQLAEDQRAAMLHKGVPSSSRGPLNMGDLICFYKCRGEWKWFGPSRVIGQEGRGALWVCQCRRSTGGEMVAGKTCGHRRELDEVP